MLDLIEPVLAFLILMTGAVALCVVYFVPTVVVLLRRPVGGTVGAVIVLNLFLGWTFLGWVASLALAMVGNSTPRYRHVAGAPQPYTYDLPAAAPTAYQPGVDGTANGVPSETASFGDFQG